MTLPNNLRAMRTKVRKITARTPSQMTDLEIDSYINTFYVYDLPQHLKLESLRYTYQFTTKANIPVYDFPTDTYLTAMPPVYIGGYQSYMTQSRDNFFRINPALSFLQTDVYTGDGTDGSTGSYAGQFLINTPIVPGYKPNPPGAYAANSNPPPVAAKFINWNIVVSAQGSADPTSGITPTYTLIDDGLGNLIDPADPGTTAPNGYQYRGTVNYITGAIAITLFQSNIPSGNPINVQYIPYVPSRPQSCMFFQDQIILFPVPDQAYTVSFEAYKYPTAFIQNANPDTTTPQLNEWWQLLAYGAADKIFSDNGDLESMQKFRPLLDEQMRLALRRTLVQQTPERTPSIYTEQAAFAQYPFGNLFGGF